MDKSSCFYHSDITQSMGRAALDRHSSSVLSLLLIYGHGHRGLLTASARGSRALSQDCGYTRGHVREDAQGHLSGVIVLPALAQCSHFVVGTCGQQAQGLRGELGLSIPVEKRKGTGKISINPWLHLQMHALTTWD